MLHVCHGPGHHHEPSCFHKSTSPCKVSAVINAMGDLLLEADPEVRIELRDFGVFEVKKTKAKPKARNPKTNETVFIPSRRKTHFKPSKRLKEVLQVPLHELDYKIPEGSADKGMYANGQSNGASNEQVHAKAS